MIGSYSYWLKGDRVPSWIMRSGRRSPGTRRSWANPIEAHFGPLRQFTLANSYHPDHTVQTRELHHYLHWRNTNARHPDVLAAQRRDGTRIRGEKGLRWGGRPLLTAVWQYVP